MRWHPIRRLLLILWLTLPFVLPAQEKPNIIFIMADDLGYGDLGSYGQQVIETPFIDQMAREGRRFTQCYAGSPVCAPSRSTLMTGQHTGHTRIRGNFGKTGVIGLGGGQGRVPLEAEDLTLAEVLKAAGYVTGMAGKWGLGEPETPGHPNLQGFDAFFGYLNQRRAHEYYPTYLWENTQKVPLPGNESGGQQSYSHDLIHRFALDFIETHADTPFFLYIPYTLPHDKYQIPHVGKYGQQPWKEEEKVYAAMVTLLDSHVGEILNTLGTLQIRQNTLVFFCSDNGAAQRWEGRFDSSGPLRGRKRDLYEGGIRTPMIAWWPGHIPAGTTSDLVWYFPDILPTLAALTGQKEEKNWDGINVLPAIWGEQNGQKNDRTLYWEFHERGFQQALRWGRWKAIRLEPDQPIALYDMALDPNETNDLSDSKEKLVKKMGRLMSKMRTPSTDWPVTN